MLVADEETPWKDVHQKYDRIISRQVLHLKLPMNGKQH
jgi:hypothetical protein